MIIERETTALTVIIDKKTVNKQIVEQCVVGRKERPTQPIFFNNCKNIKFDNIYILNSPCWTVMFSNCDGIEVESVYIDNHPRILNNDGLHFTASKNITVKDSTFLCADDCIACTCITNTEGICENIEICDCFMQTRSAAIRFGHLYSKVRNANVRNIKVSASNRAVCVFAGNGGFVENICVDGIDSMSRIYSGNWWGKGEGFVPVLGNAHPYYSNKLDLAPNLRNLCNEEFISRNSEIFVFNGERDNIEIIGTECGVDFKEGKHI